MSRSPFSPIVRERLSLLAESFPVLRGHGGVRPFDLATLVRAFHADYDPMMKTLLASGPPGPPNLTEVLARGLAIDFLLRICGHISVKVPANSPLAHSFDAVGALLTWAEPERDAFLAWAAGRWVPVGPDATAEPPSPPQTIH